MRIEDCWQLYAELLKDPQKLKTRLDENMASYPELYERGVGLLDDFFEKQEGPVDICIILYDGLKSLDKLAYHIDGNNFLFYRPKASRKRVVNQNFLKGTPDPERTLLLFDEDMIGGNAIKETADYFENLGYDREKICAYLELGCQKNNRQAELGHVDELLAMPKLAEIIKFRGAGV